MMKIFMVIYLFGQVHGAIGPLPYEMKECVDYENILNEDIHEKSQEKSLKFMGEFFYKCELHDEELSDFKGQLEKFN